MRTVLLSSLLLLATATIAHADAIGPDPTDCIEGSTPVMGCHGPPTCEIADCENDDDCGAGMTCTEKALCVREHCCSGMCCAFDCGTEPTRYTHVAGSCEGSGNCAAVGGDCQSLKVCVASTPPTDGGAPGTDSGTPPGRDSGAPGQDSGTPAQDSGTPPGTDAGTGGEGGDDGGCCAVFGGRQSGALPLLLAAAIGGLLLGRRRR